MSYFAEHYASLSLPIASATEPGLRNAQLGAIHAVASYFTLHTDPLRADPALVVLPTGAGKTAVLLACAFLLRARRVLIVTPSRAVRNQIAGEAGSLRVFRHIGALAENLAQPEVHEVLGRLATPEAWGVLAAYDVVVGTPSSLSPGAKGVAAPPVQEDGPLFDLVLMDEAHHSPAKTWKALLAAFPAARKVLTTATPFRLDEREIRASLVYEYPLTRALADRIICRLDYVPVEVPRSTDRDEALARRAEAELRAEQQRNPAYRLLVRTDRRAHADELLKLYGRCTGLKLRALHSGHSQIHIESSLKKLRAGDLDGLLCVDMLGEGFDFPPLKVAAIHRKHKSLPVTLQFVGRFGRVTSRPEPDTDDERAKILAVPEELAGEIEHLYDESSAWAEMIPNLFQARRGFDETVRRDLATFSVAAEVPQELEETSLWGLEPLAHVKIYEVDPGVNVDIAHRIRFPPGRHVVYRTVSRELSAAVFLTREQIKPPWANADVALFNQVRFDLFVVHWNEPARLLFISASRRGSVMLYEEIARHYTGQAVAEDTGESAEPCHHILPLYKINRVLRGTAGANCFNLGMRMRQKSQVNESYRILAGPEVERAVKPSDGRLYHRGHVMVGVFDAEAERMVTFGYSSSSKVWQGKYVRVPLLVQWCRELAAKIAADGPVDSSENLEVLPVGAPLEELPDNLITATWDDEVYQRTFHLVENATGGDEVLPLCELLDASWAIDPNAVSRRAATLHLEYRDHRWPIIFSLDEPRLFTAEDRQALPRIRTAQEEGALLDYLNASPLYLYTADFALVRGREIFAASEVEPFDPRCFQPLDWQAKGVVLKSEFGWTDKEKQYTRPGFDRATIHGYFVEYLEEAGFPTILYDHGSGEIADFIAIEETRWRQPRRWWEGEEERDAVHVYLFHAKGAGGAKPGNRVGDAYEVCGQVVKSVIWVARRRDLADHLRRRLNQGSFFVRGDLRTAAALLAERRRAVHFHIAVVQPGLTAGEVSPRIQEILAAADDYVRHAVDTPMLVFSSP